MGDRLVRFRLFGLEYTFYSDAPDNEVDAIIALLREELEESVATNRSTVPSSKLLVLGCLRMTARYEQLRRKHETEQQEQGRVVKRLTQKISAQLDQQTAVSRPLVATAESKNPPEKTADDALLDS